MRFLQLVVLLGLLPSLSVVVAEHGQKGIAIGVGIAETPEDPTLFDGFASQIGRMPAIVMWYQAWGGDAASTAFRPELLENVASRGPTPMITWEPWVPLYYGHDEATMGSSTSSTTTISTSAPLSDPSRIPGRSVVDQPAYRLANILRGDFDAYIDAWAVGLARYGQPVYLRFAHEMNGDWYPWGAGVNGNTTMDYVTAWRYVHGRFAAARAYNVRWVWTPMVWQSISLADVYPGDAYVDWIGLDGYNWGTVAPSWRTPGWQSFADVFERDYQSLAALTSKPIMIAETASAEEGGDKAIWISDAFNVQLPRNFPRVRAVVWFNFNKETDWRIDSSPAALQAFFVAVHSPYLQGTLP